MAAPTENVLLIPPKAGTNEVLFDLSRELELVLEPGGSAVLFAPGRAASVNTKQLWTVLVVTVGLEEETRKRIYQYLFAIQAITHRLRPVILTDGEDLRTIRQYGWVTEHIMPRPYFEDLKISTRWESWVVDRIRAIAVRLDVACVVMCGPGGISTDQHDMLMRRMKQSIPFAATKA